LNNRLLINFLIWHEAADLPFVPFKGCAIAAMLPKCPSIAFKSQNVENQYLKPKKTNA